MEGFVEFRILGPFEVVDEGRPLALAGHKQRALLALLLLHRGQIVSVDRLIDDLWAERPPASAANSIHVYISQLRKTLGNGALETRGRGYLLHVEPEALDLGRFDRLLERGRELLGRGDPAAAVEVLREALGLWRGAPLADFAYESFAQGEIARLEELHLTALEERLDADLALGRHAEVVAELETLVSDHPLRERMRAQLMLALYRSGRQADALEAYHHGRRVLVDGLGIEPGPDLRDLQGAILRQDDELAAPARRQLAPPRPRHRRAGLLIAAGGAALLAAGMAAAIVALTGDGDAELTRVGPNSVAAIDPSTNRIVADVAVGGSPSIVAVGERAVWVLNSDDQTISKIDPASRAVLKTFATLSRPTDLAVGPGVLWVGNGRRASASQLAGSLVPRSVSRIDADSGLVERRMRLPFSLRGGPVPVGPTRPGGHGIAVGHHAVWVINGDSTVSRVDPDTGRVAARIRRLAAGSIAVDDRSVWIADLDNSIVRIDPRTNTVAQTVSLTTFFLSAIATGAGAVWATDPNAGTLWRIDPGTTPVTRTIPVGIGASSVAFGEGSIWVVNDLDGTVLRVDPKTNRVVARIAVGGTPRQIAVGGGRVWVAVGLAEGPSRAASGAPSQGQERVLPASACGQFSYGGSGSPELVIASNLPLQSGPRASTVPMAQAIEFVLARHGFRAGRHTVGYQSCDDATAQAGGEDPAKCAANAKAFAAAGKVVGVIGPYGSECAATLIPIANRASGGPLAVLSTSSSNPGLTRRLAELPGDPSDLYPTGLRNFARLIPADDYQGAAHALLATQLGAKRVFVLRGRLGDPYGLVLANAFRRAARKLRLDVVGEATWSAKAGSYRPLAARVRAARPDAVFLAGLVFDRGGPLVEELRRSLGRDVEILAPDGFAIMPELSRVAGSAAKGMYMSFLGVPNPALAAAGQRFLQAFSATQRGGAVPSYSAAYAAQAAEVLLQAIERSDGTRASVTRELLRVRIQDGILGTFSIDRDGDISANPTTILRLTGNRTRSPTLVADHRGSVIDRVITPPRRLILDGGP